VSKSVFTLLLFVLSVRVLAQPGMPQSGVTTETQRSTSSANESPQILRSIGIDQHLNEQLPLNLEFTDESGQVGTLRDFIRGKPIILNFAYFNCPMLCGQVANGLTAALKVIDFTPGNEFDVLTVSFDPRETPEDAVVKRASYLKEYGKPVARDSWHFLTGTQDAIESITKTAGFRYQFDSTKRQFAHASGIIVLTPEGKVSKYFYGIDYSAKDLKFALMDASKLKIGTLVDKLLLYCYHYDPATGKYGAEVLTIMRMGGVVTVGLILGMFVWFRRKNRIKLREAGV
jgi:protein SCO1